MSFVDKILEVLGGSRSRGNTKEAGDMIAKGSVVRMLLDSHQLDDIVASFLDSLQIVICKVSVG